MLAFSEVHLCSSGSALWSGSLGGCNSATGHACGVHTAWLSYWLAKQRTLVQSCPTPVKVHVVPLGTCSPVQLLLCALAGSSGVAHGSALHPGLLSVQVPLKQLLLSQVCPSASSWHSEPLPIKSSPFSPEHAASCQLANSGLLSSVTLQCSGVHCTRLLSQELPSTHDTVLQLCPSSSKAHELVSYSLPSSNGPVPGE